MELIASIITFAILVTLALFGFRKLHRKLNSVFIELAKLHVLLIYASRREQKIKYDLDRQKSKLERILKKIK